MFGSIGSEPVHTTTAWVAVSTVTAPSSAVTVTSFVPLSLPWPRTSAMPVLSSQSTWLWSFQSCVKLFLRASTAATSNSPLTACFAPPSRFAALSAMPLRIKAFDGMHAQYEQSPPTSSLSTTTAVRPPCTIRSATFSATAPPPMTITSKWVWAEVFMFNVLRRWRADG